MGKRITVPLLVVALLAFGLATPASADEGRATQLALGDSVPFGFSPLIFASGGAVNASNFVGYPEIVAKSLDLKDVNATCPGQTTGGFFNLQGTDNGCFPYRAVFPLHVSYSGTQLDFAVNYLRSHDNVKLVTMTLGANDVFLLRDSCLKTPDPVTCLNNGLPAVQKTIDDNLRFIFDQLRERGHYHGLLVTLTYYSLAYDPLSVAGTQALNQPIVDATRDFDGTIASGFNAFRAPALAAGGSSCAAGLLIQLSAPPAQTCDVHPAPKGRDLLAKAVVKVVEENHEH